MFKKLLTTLTVPVILLSSSLSAVAAPMGVVDSTGEEQGYVDAMIEATCFYMNTDNFDEEYINEQIYNIFSSYGFSESEADTLAIKYENNIAVNEAVESGLNDCSESLFEEIENMTQEQENFASASAEVFCSLDHYELSDLYSPELEHESREIFRKYGFDIFNTTEMDAILEKYKNDRVVRFTFSTELENCLPESSYEDVLAKIEKFDLAVFPDVSSDHKDFVAINYLNQSGVIQGYADGNFKPEQSINRAEFLKILIKNRGWDIKSYANCFPDVQNQWFANYVCYASEQGWVQGYVDGTFKPEQTVSKAEALKMLFEIYSDMVSTPESVATAPFQDVATSDWHAKYVSNAKNKGLLDTGQNYFAPNQAMTRGSVCAYVFDLLVYMVGAGV